MRVASAILKSGRVYVQGYAQTTSGVWIGRGPVYVGSISSPTDMGANVRASLAHSIQGVPHPDKAGWRDVQQPMLEAVGARSWGALAKGARSVGIECHDSVVTLTPSCNYEKDGGLDLPEQAISVPITADELGTKLAEAFDLSS